MDEEVITDMFRGLVDSLARDYECGARGYARLHGLQLILADVVFFEPPQLPQEELGIWAVQPASRRATAGRLTAAHELLAEHCAHLEHVFRLR